jgi:hypothetical protein
LSAALAGSFLLQGYLAIFHPSSFGRFAEFPFILIYAAAISSATFLLLVVPGFVWLQHTHRKVSWHAGFIIGFVLGCIVMLLFMTLCRQPIQTRELVSGGIAGAVGISIYARLTNKRVA